MRTKVPAAAALPMLVGRPSSVVTASARHGWRRCGRVRHAGCSVPVCLGPSHGSATRTRRSRSLGLWLGVAGIYSLEAPGRPSRLSTGADSDSRATSSSSQPRRRLLHGVSGGPSQSRSPRPPAAVRWHGAQSSLIDMEIRHGAPLILTGRLKLTGTYCCLLLTPSHWQEDGTTLKKRTNSGLPEWSPTVTHPDRTQINCPSRRRRAAPSHWYRGPRAPVGCNIQAVAGAAAGCHRRILCTLASSG